MTAERLNVRMRIISNDEFPSSCEVSADYWSVFATQCVIVTLFMSFPFAKSDVSSKKEIQKNVCNVYCKITCWYNFLENFKIGITEFVEKWIKDLFIELWTLWSYYSLVMLISRQLTLGYRVVISSRGARRKPSNNNSVLKIISLPAWDVAWPVFLYPGIIFCFFISGNKLLTCIFLSFWKKQLLFFYPGIRADFYQTRGLQRVHN